MKIYGLANYQPIFMAHTYKVEPRYQHVYVQTDNEDNLGEKPYFIYYNDVDDKRYQIEMKKDGKVYSIDRAGDEINCYHIEYKDTGNIDKKNGQEYRYNPNSMINKASIATRLQYKQPIIYTIKEGKTVGKIKWNKSVTKNIDNITEPTIIVTPKFDLRLDNPNIVGLIFTQDHTAALAHHGTMLRQGTDVCGAVFEPEIINKLISMDGKNVELEIKDSKINFKETKETGKPLTYPTIDVPKLKPCNKIITSKEYSLDIIGAKAVNLRRLEELKEQGKIDVIIPKSIALPSGYLEPFNTYNVVNYKKIWNEYMNIDELLTILKDNGINDKNGIFVRSAFNGEDLPNYSAAGIYETKVVDMEPRALTNTIDRVVKSKYCPDATYSRKMYNIPEENIQPGVILQEGIDADYKFTLYTDDKKGNLKIEMYSDYEWHNKDTLPHIFTFNKETGKLSYDSIQMSTPAVTFNENEEIIELEPIKNDLSNNKKLYEQVEKIAKNALVVEKEFGAPQDIEGGIKGDDIYFWQTRNIV